MNSQPNPSQIIPYTPPVDNQQRAIPNQNIIPPMPNQWRGHYQAPRLVKQRQKSHALRLRKRLLLTREDLLTASQTKENVRLVRSIIKKHYKQILKNKSSLGAILPFCPPNYYKHIKKMSISYGRFIEIFEPKAIRKTIKACKYVKQINMSGEAKKKVADSLRLSQASTERMHQIYGAHPLDMQYSRTLGLKHTLLMLM